MFTNNLHTELRRLLQQHPHDKVLWLVYAEKQQTHTAIRDMLTEVPDDDILVLTKGEENKNLQQLEQIWMWMLGRQATRRTILVNIGGGMLTDLGGLAASTYKRGIRFINIPTTLLAMVDASTGGKTGCNLGGIKNCIGTFAQPMEVLICTDTLETLPADEWLSGYGEMLKHGLIAGHEHWAEVLRYDIEKGDTRELLPLLQRSLEVKERIVRLDPAEQGMRKALNLGHTIGHAIEEMSQGTLRHGYCVVWGLIGELYLSVTKLGLDKQVLQQLVQLCLHYYGRPECKCSQRDELIALMRQDKKNECADTINFTLLSSPGKVQINQQASVAEINEALDFLFSI